MLSKCLFKSTDLLQVEFDFIYILYYYRKIKNSLRDREEAGGVVQWWSVRLACMRPWDRSPAPRNREKHLQVEKKSRST